MNKKDIYDSLIKIKSKDEKNIILVIHLKYLNHLQYIDLTIHKFDTGHEEVSDFKINDQGEMFLINYQNRNFFDKTEDCLKRYPETIKIIFGISLLLITNLLNYLLTK